MAELKYLYTDRIIKKFFTSMEAEGDGWDPLELTLAPSNLLLTVPRRYFLRGTFCFMLCSVSVTNVFHVTII